MWQDLKMNFISFLSCLLFYQYTALSSCEWPSNVFRRFGRK